MNTVLWVFQIVLAIVFLLIGCCKSLIPEKRLVAMGQTGVEGLSPVLIKFIGISEILAAVGLIFPWYLNICSILTPVAALGLGTIMILASIIHYKRFIAFSIKKEKQNSINNLIILSICIFIALGRFLNIN